MSLHSVCPCTSEAQCFQRATSRSKIGELGGRDCLSSLLAGNEREARPHCLLSRAAISEEKDLKKFLEAADAGCGRYGRCEFSEVEIDKILKIPPAAMSRSGQGSSRQCDAR